MDIYGLQKMTLLDYPGKVACTVFLAGCNFRCPFCHNAELAERLAPPVMEDGELLAFLKKRQGLLEGVAVTGGEPLLSPGLPALLRSIKELGYPVKLDTDGGYPDRLADLISEGLVDYVAMDVKNAPADYAATCGVDYVNLDTIRESIRILMEGTVEYEFRTTVVAQLHREESFTGIGKMIEGARKYFLQPFKDRDTVKYAGFTPPSEELLRRAVDIMKSYVKEVEVRGAIVS